MEKGDDGKPFDLHTPFEDRASYYGSLRNPWLCIFLPFGLLGIVNRSIVLGALALVSLIPVILYQVQIMKVKQDAKTREW